jgi:hypothetical protein
MGLLDRRSAQVVALVPLSIAARDRPLALWFDLDLLCRAERRVAA